MVLTSCSLFTPEEQVPSWIHIESFGVVDNPEVYEGSLSHDITDAWVFIDEEMIGIYELPATIPILEEGEHRLLVGPGIKVSTVSTLRDNYLFYNGYETTINLKKDETLEVSPVTSYRNSSAYTYEVVDDFETAFLAFVKDADSDANFVRTSDPSIVFEGSGSGMMVINDTMDAAAFRTAESFVLPGLGKTVFMELDYYTDFDLTIGLVINNAGFSDETIDYVTLRRNESGEFKWKKAYIALTSVISGAVNPEDMYPYFIAQVGYEDAPSSGMVLIDNVKFLYEN